MIVGTLRWKSGSVFGIMGNGELNSALYMSSMSRAERADIKDVKQRSDYVSFICNGNR